MNNDPRTELGTTQIVTVPRMQLLYLEVPHDPENQQRAWPEFEARFPSLTNRKMYGLDYDTKGVYRACSLVLDSDKGKTFGLEQFAFPGGDYARLRLKLEPPELYGKIGPAYSQLFRQYEETIEWSLPLIEYYKAREVLDIMVPLKK